MFELTDVRLSGDAFIRDGLTGYRELVDANLAHHRHEK
jgi:hypothetical protein